MRHQKDKHPRTALCSFETNRLAQSTMEKAYLRTLPATRILAERDEEHAKEETTKEG